MVTKGGERAVKYMLQRDGKKWIIVGGIESDWISKRKFSQKYKAELAIRIWERGGRVSASRGHEALDQSTPIIICRQPGDPNKASVLLKDLSDFHLRETSGGIQRNFGRLVLCARIWCNRIADLESFGHSCAHGPGPHEIVVSINRTDNDRMVFNQLLASAQLQDDR